MFACPDASAIVNASEGIRRELPSVACWAEKPVPHTSAVGSLGRWDIASVPGSVSKSGKSTSTLFDGYKVHVAEDLETELLTDVEVTPDNAHDSGPVEEMLTDSAARLGAMPTEIIGDSHYGSKDLRTDLGQHGTRHRGRRQAADPKGDRFTKADFEIDLEAESVTCPAGHTTEKDYRRRDDKGRQVRAYRFPAATCRACPLKPRCTRSKRGRHTMLC